MWINGKQESEAGSMKEGLEPVTPVETRFGFP